MLRFILPFMLIAAAGLAPRAAEPAAQLATQGGPMAGEGHRLARQWCAGCHAVSRGMPPPAGDAAPGFPAIAALPGTTETSLRAFLQTPHANMPDFQLSRAELDALVGYLLAMRP